MIELIIIGAANLIVGGFIGMTGVAGFLLPMLYAGYLEMSVPESLALSFCAFLISGILGSWNYYKQKNLDVKLAVRLGIGSLAGALAGVALNSFIPEDKVKILLYAVVLLSGISILLRKENKTVPKKADAEGGNLLGNHLTAPLLLGAVTGAICSLSGAGGPVLVMPLLVMFGVSVRTAVGVALFDSIFIAIPSIAGYVMQTDVSGLLAPLFVAVITHGIGVYAGSLQAERIRQDILKKGIAVFSIGIAVWKLFW